MDDTIATVIWVRFRRCEGLAPPGCEAQLGLIEMQRRLGLSSRIRQNFICDTKLQDGMYCTSSSDRRPTIVRGA
jgi:hypothetical protein